MRATIMHAAGDVRIEKVPDATIRESTDALLTVTRACICGSDLWPYRSMQRSDRGQSMGHEAIGVVEAVGADVRTVKQGGVVVMPFASSDGTCIFCHEGLPTACIHLSFFGNQRNDGAQAEAIRIPYADGTLLPLPVGKDDALMPSLLTLADVMGTGHQAAVEAAVEITRAGGAIGRVGVPQDAAMAGSQTTFYHNVTVGGGPAPVSAYIPALLPDILEGRIQPGRVFGRVVNLDGVPGGHRDMNDRKAVKVMVRP